MLFAERADDGKLPRHLRTELNHDHREGSYLTVLEGPEQKLAYLFPFRVIKLKVHKGKTCLPLIPLRLESEGEQSPGAQVRSPGPVILM